MSASISTAELIPNADSFDIIGDAISRNARKGIKNLKMKFFMILIVVLNEN
jgi:hypothetical protein